jgi:hypothetical protein
MKMSGIFAKYNCNCCLFVLERENSDFRLAVVLMCVFRVCLDSVIWEISIVG